MQCLKPNKGYYKEDGTHVFGKSITGHEREHDIPCGYCQPCRTAKAKLRGFKSFTNTLYAKGSMFLTLTYGAFAPITPNYSLTLDKSIIPRFIKRLRKYIQTESRRLGVDIPRIGVLYCGEYGDKDERPHYHVIIYNYKFNDLQPWRKSKSGHQCFRSLILEKLWPYGHSEIGTVTAASCTYVATYIYKKQYGKNKEKHYGDRVPEYVVTPKRNFVSGREYIRNNIESLTQHGCFKTIEGYSIGIDTHTMDWISQEFPEHAKKIKLAKESFELNQMDKKELMAWELTNAKKQELQKARR